jgi:hypothetical protein
VAIGGGPFEEGDLDSGGNPIPANSVKIGQPYNLATGYKAIAIGSGAWVVKVGANGQPLVDEDGPNEAIQIGTGINSADNTAQFGGASFPVNAVKIYQEAAHSADGTDGYKRLATEAEVRKDYVPRNLRATLGTGSVAIGGNGGGAECSARDGTAIGPWATVQGGSRNIAIGFWACAIGDENIIQIGHGENRTANTVNFGGSSSPISKVTVTQSAAQAADGVAGRKNLATEAWVARYVSQNPGSAPGGANVPLSVVDGKLCVTFEEV